jgi:hypothetical protein
LINVDVILVPGEVVKVHVDGEWIKLFSHELGGLFQSFELG